MNMNNNLLRGNTMAQPMLGMGNPSFGMQNNQQPLSQNPMNLAPGMNSNPGLGMMPNSTMGIPGNQRMFIQPGQQQQLPQQGRPMMRPGGPGGQHMMPPGSAPGGQHMTGMNPQMQGMGFPQGMVPGPQSQMGPNGIRRVPSQNLGPPNMGQAVQGGMSLSMPGVNAQIQGQMQQMQMRHSQQHQVQQRALVAAAANRQSTSGMLGGGVGGGNPSQGQIMSSLAQPGSMGPQPHPMFPNGVGIPSTQGMTTSSPRNGPVPLNSISGMPPGSSPIGPNRASMTPDNSNMGGFGPYPGSQFPAGMGGRPPPQGGQFPFQPPSTPPMSDAADSPAVNMMNQGTPNSQPRSGFPTPAQQLQMNNINSMNPSNPDSFSGQHFPMAPPSGAPPRPPSQTPHQMGMQMQPPLQPQMTPQPPQSMGTPGSHTSPLPSGASDANHPSRPQSRLQQAQPHPMNVPMANPGVPSRRQTPQNGQLPLSGGSMGMPHQQQQGLGRIPPSQASMNPRQPTPVSGSQPNPSPHQPQQPQLQQGPIPPSQLQTTPGALQQPQQPQTPGAGGMRLPPQGPQPTMNGLNPSAGAPNRGPAPRGQQYTALQLGHGQGIIRLLQFSNILAADNYNDKLNLDWWMNTIQNFYTPQAVMKLTLWKDNQTEEAKVFSDIGTIILPRFFLVTHQSGVQSMSLALNGARERMQDNNHCVIECPEAIWTFFFSSGYTITLKGPFTAHIHAAPVPHGAPPPIPGHPNNNLRIDEMHFESKLQYKSVSLDAIQGERRIETHKPITPTPLGNPVLEEQIRQLEDPRILITHANLPGEPINAFGIPQATMRCLELAESVGAMDELIEFASYFKCGPLDGLIRYAQGLKWLVEDPEFQAKLPAPEHGYPLPWPPWQKFFKGNHMWGRGPDEDRRLESKSETVSSNIPPTPSASLPNTSQVIPPPPQALINSPRNTPSSASNSPQKQNKSIPQPLNSSQPSGSVSSPTMSSGTASNTPALAPASLKRKQPLDGTSPTVTNAEGPPTKRNTRKSRPRTNTNGAG